MSEIFDGQNESLEPDDIVDGSSGLTALLSSEKLAILQKLWEGSRGDLDSRASLRRVTSLFAELLGADNCSWLASCRDRTPSDMFSVELFNGWWAVDQVDFREGVDTKKSRASYYAYTKANGLDPLSQLSLRNIGKTRALSRKGLFTEEEWLNHSLRNDYLLPMFNVTERILVVYNIDQYSESCFIVDREEGGEPFSDRDLQLAYIATVGLSAFHHRLFFERGFLEPATKPLSPREREVFSLLLRDFSEKEIADQMGISVHTAHQYITSIFRVFKVRGRNGLLSALMKVTQ